MIRIAAEERGQTISQILVKDGKLKGEAVFDPSGRYRYQLSRQWNDGNPGMCFVMLNPSTADASKNDPTIRRCIGFARKWGFGSMEVVNLFGYRATDWRDLARGSDPVGPHNDAFLYDSVDRADFVIAAWGNHGILMGQALWFLSRTERAIHCLGLTVGGHPRHPLYVSGEMEPVPLCSRVTDPSPAGATWENEVAEGGWRCAS